MKRLFVLILLLWSSTAHTQYHFPIYEWEEVKNASPDTIFGITFKKMKLEALPSELEKFTELKILIAGKNRLTELPDFIATFTDLEEIHLGKNGFTSFPSVICELKSLKKLILNRTEIATIPECIGSLSNLEYIDLYDSPIRTLPNSLVELQSLKEVDLSGIRFKPGFQEKWIKLLPEVDFDFDPPCNCM